MATITLKLYQIFILAFPFISYTLASCYKSIINFGDSISDTGNLAAAFFAQTGKPAYIAQPPYGETYFQHPTGRCSDGRLIIDFIAQDLGLPLIPPVLGNGSSNFEKGANLAFAGATALNTSFLQTKGIRTMFPNISLDVQLSLFHALLPKLCPTPSECKAYLGESLVLMGEIGGNDYNYGFAAKRSLQELQQLVPFVVDQIIAGAQALINMGAKTVWVPGNFPCGCSAGYLTSFQNEDKRQYDSCGCIKWLNEFAEFHNDHLQKKLHRLRKLNPNTAISYVDYYNATLRLYASPKKYGFSGDIFRACCGGGGPYNYNPAANCGTPLASACNNPSMSISWDGIHFTEAAYRSIFHNLFKGKSKHHETDSTSTENAHNHVCSGPEVSPIHEEL